MNDVYLRTNEEFQQVIVPESLLTFVKQWAKEGGHAPGDVVLSLLSHGLMHVRMLQDLGPELNNMIMGITQEMADMAPKDATIVEVRIHDDEMCPYCEQVH